MNGKDVIQNSYLDQQVGRDPFRLEYTHFGSPKPNAVIICEGILCYILLCGSSTTNGWEPLL